MKWFNIHHQSFTSGLNKVGCELPALSGNVYLSLLSKASLNLNNDFRPILAKQLFVSTSFGLMSSTRLLLSAFIYT